MPKTSVADTLKRMSYELDALAAATDEFHELAFSHGDKAPSMSSAFVSTAQRIDLSQQILANLSDFLAGLATELPETLAMDLEEPLALVTLSDLKNRLRGEVAGPMSEMRAAGPNSGEMEFF
ncbi:hypothetical protein ASG43_17700 [Aureimonas sp. Leaf454]|uniref:hypothetical protein n=1 Tax=Aureimonas sp. Leaf454 TaxID=1736381 RepID=UPI0006FF2F70|nr:hypothetical protein [Aureimonas sp. Leaf454]KQT53672.1 hypothetical protein ASG43_17700 [Aureimonas sp. Leaf454]